MLLAAALMGYIFYLSSQSSTGFSLVETGSVESQALRKLGHAAVFGLLAVLLRWGVALGPGRRRAALLALLLTVGYAAADEFHQTFTPGRHGAVTDVFIDTAGAVLALAAWALFVHRQPAWSLVRRKVRRQSAKASPVRHPEPEG